MRKWLIALGALFILGFANFSIWHNEQLIQHGETVVLELLPVDPRSLMQGDYMALHFAMADTISKQLPAHAKNLTGEVIVQLDQHRRAHFVGINHVGQQAALQADQLALQFRLRNGQVKFASNAFFFQEGTGHFYEPAKYGVFRVGASGQLLLTHLLDAELQPLGETRSLQPVPAD